MVSVNDSSSSGGSIFWQWSYPKSTNKLFLIHTIMKRNKLTMAVVVLLCGSLMFSSCIGSFGLTKDTLFL